MNYPAEIFKSIPIVCISCKKHLEKLKFTKHIKEKVQKAGYCIGTDKLLVS